MVFARKLYQSGFCFLLLLKPLEICSLCFIWNPRLCRAGKTRFQSNSFRSVKEIVLSTKVNIALTGALDDG